GGASYVPMFPEAVEDLAAMIARRDLPEFPLRLSQLLDNKARAGVVPFRRPATSRSANHVAEEFNPAIKQRWDILAACTRVATAAEGTRNDTLNKEVFIAGMQAVNGAVD